MELSEQQRKSLIQMIMYETEGVELRTHYSGRYMYGKECVGFVARWFDDLISFLTRLTTDLSEDLDENDCLLKCLRSGQMDSMGLDSIIYFPEIGWGTSPVLEGSEEDDE